jgi:hypothetical protein
VGIASFVSYNDCKGRGEGTSMAGVFHPKMRAIRWNQMWIGGSVHTCDRKTVDNIASSAKMDGFWL